MTTTLLPPLKFSPLVKPTPWGGRKLESVFGKPLPEGVPCGEAWEIVDLPGEQSIINQGPLAGHDLAWLVANRRQELMGEAELLLGRFPVLFKLLDATETLSVQVHPDEDACQRLGAGARPKTEAWYILEAEEGAKLYVGLAEGVSAAEFRSALASGQIEPLLQAIEVQPGEFIYLPSGTLHAIGAGILLAEIQQSSDTTYRVFDWNRVGLDGKPRALHVAEALESIHFDVSGKPPHAEPLSGRPGIRCPAFGFERVGLGAGSQTPLDAGRPRIICCVEGSGHISQTGEQPLQLTLGETCLVPACRAESLVSEEGGTFLLVRV